MLNTCELHKNKYLPIISIVKDLEINRLIGKNLRRLRDSRKLSLSKFADIVGSTPQRISGIENGREPMGKAMMEKICGQLNVRPWEFYIEEDTPLITDSSEKRQLELFREARALGVAEEVTRYGMYQIEGARRAAAGSVDERLRRGHELLKKHLRKKKSA